MFVRHAFPLVCTVLLACAGCGGGGGPSVVPVSGRVTLDGEPVADAFVRFVPEAVDMPGLDSGAQTDADGRYTLNAADGRDGAIVGTHRIRITTLSVPTGDSGSAVSESDEAVPPDRPELIPVIYNANSQLNFDVPAGGTDEANFQLSSTGG